MRFITRGRILVAKNVCLFVYWKKNSEGQTYKNRIHKINTVTGTKIDMHYMDIITEYRDLNRKNTRIICEK